MERYEVVVNNYILGSKIGCLQNVVEEIETIDSRHKKVIFKVESESQKNYIETLINYKMKKARYQYYTITENGKIKAIVIGNKIFQ